MLQRSRLVAILLALLMALPARAQSADPEVVVLLHGLARTAASMDKLESALRADGYKVCNIDYPSRQHPIEVLAHQHVLPAIQACLGTPLPRLNVVAHSLGGIITRQLAHDAAISDFGRVVMLGPPNQGSEVVDKLKHLPPFQWLNGPAGQQLGTDRGARPSQLGPAPFELGVVAGRRSINWLLSLLIPGDDDGKVSIARTRLPGMQDHLIMPVSHPFLMRDGEVIRQVRSFLASGRFAR